jgi:SAM-dependent methyltransferase
MQNCSSDFWDKMAKRYPRYNDEAIQNDAKIIFRFAKKQGVTFKDKTVIDIGCGTGTLALPLASEAKKILGLDVSQPMLEIFQSDVQALDVENTIDIYNTSWDAFDLQQSFDVAIASMTPAVANASQYEKFIGATHAYAIFVGWGSYKTNDVIDTIIEQARSQKTQNLNQAKRFCAYLDKKQIRYAVEFFETSWTNEYEFDEAFEYATTHLQNRGLNVAPALVKEVLKRLSQNNRVVFTTKAQKGVVVLQKGSK